MKISTHFKIRVVKLSRLEHRANNARVESSSLSLAKLLLRDRSFICCRKERQGEGHCKNATKTMETQNGLKKTAAELARLDHRANITKAENFRSPKTEGSVRKQASSFAAVQNRKPKSRSPSVNNKNIEDINSFQNQGGKAQWVRASC